MQTAEPDENSGAMSQGAATVEAVLERLNAHVEKTPGDRIPLGDVLHAIGDRGFGPIILALALVVVSPFGGIPAIPTLFALILTLVAVQLLIGRDSLWLPDRVHRTCIPGEKLRGGIGWLRPVARRLDRWFGDRLRPLTAEPVRRAAALAVVVLCLVVPPLEFVPFAALIPMTAIALFGLAITLRDGIVMVVAFAATGGALIGGTALLLSQT